MKKILVPIDGSTASRNAATQALAFAKKYGSEITFITVVEIASELSYDLGSINNADYSDLISKIVDYKVESETKMLDDMLKTMDCNGINTEKKIIVGSAHPVIVEVALDGHYDLIVMGHRGLNPIKRIFLGSVAKMVIEDAPCSVLIVK